MSDQTLKFVLRADNSQSKPVLKETADQLNKISDASDGVGKSYESAGQSLSKLSSSLTGIGAVMTGAITAPIAAVIGLGISFDALQEQAQVAFTTMIGDGNKAKVFLEDMKEFAARTPFEFPDLIRATQRMMAYGFAATETLPVLTAIGDAAAALGGGAETIDRITTALGQIRAKGVLQAEEMRQLAEAGIPAWDILAKKLGVTIPDAMELVTKKAVNSKDAIAALVSGMEERFGGMMEAQAHTFNGMVSTIEDESRFLAGSLTEGLFNTLKGPAETAIKVLHDFRTELDGMSDGTKSIIAGGALMAAAVGPATLLAGALAGSVANVIKAGAAISELTTTIAASQTATAAFSLALTTLGTVGIAVAVYEIFNLKTAIDQMWESTRGLKDATERQQEAYDKLGKFYAEHGIAIELLGQKVNGHIITTKDLNAAVQSQSKDLAGTTVSLSIYADAHDKAAVANTTHQKSAAELAAEQKKFKAAVDDLVASVDKQLDQSPALVAALHQLEAAHINPILVAEKLGTKVNETALALQTNGQAVPGVIAKYVDLAQALDLASGKLFTNADLLKASASAVDSLGTAMSLIKKLPEDTFEIPPPPALPDVFSGEYIASLNRAVAAARASAESVSETQGIELARVLKDNQKQLDDAVKDVKQSAGKIFDDMLIKGESVFSSLQNALKGGALSLGRSMFEDVVGSFLGPVKAAIDDAMGQLFEKLTGPDGPVTKLTKSLVDGFKTAFDFLKDQIANNPLTFGLAAGGAAIGGATGGLSGSIAGGAAGAAIGEAVKGDWVGAAIAGAIAVGAAISGMFGTLRRQADEFVQQIQNPFADALEKISAALNKAKAAGSLTVDQVEEAKVSVQKLWSDFQDRAAAAGVVGQQALTSLTPFVNTLLNDITGLGDAAAQLQIAAAAMDIADKLKVNQVAIDGMALALTQLHDAGTPSNIIIEKLGGDIDKLMHELTLNGLAIPPIIQLYSELTAQAKEVARAHERLPAVESELSSVMDQLGDALAQKLGLLEKEIGDAAKQITDWRGDIVDLNKTIGDAGLKLADTKFWQKQYNDSIKEAADALEAATNKRASVESQIAALEITTAHDRLSAAVEIAHAIGDTNEIAKTEAALRGFEYAQRAAEVQSRIDDLTNLKAALPGVIAAQEAAAGAYKLAQDQALQSIKDQKNELQVTIDTAEAKRQTLLKSIAAENQVIAALEGSRAQTFEIMSAIGYARQTEIQKIDSTILKLIDRGIKLEAERTSLTTLLDVAKQGPDVFTNLANAVRNALNGIIAARNAIDNTNQGPIQPSGGGTTTAPPPPPPPPPPVNTGPIEPSGPYRDALGVMNYRNFDILNADGSMSYIRNPPGNWMSSFAAHLVYGGTVLDAFERGTDYVRQTGPYLLHQGEAVVPAHQNRRGGEAFNGESIRLLREIRNAQEAILDYLRVNGDRSIVIEMDKRKVGQVLAPQFQRASRDRKTVIVESR